MTLTNHNRGYVFQFHLVNKAELCDEDIQALISIACCYNLQHEFSSKNQEFTVLCNNFDEVLNIAEDITKYFLEN